MTILSCSAADCDRAQKTRTLCGMHYQRMRTHGFLEKPVETFTCKHCGDITTRNKRGPRPKYCSLKCGQKSYWDKNGESINAEMSSNRSDKRALAVRSCGFCSETFTPENSLAQKFCSTGCKNSAHRDSSTKSCSVVECGRPLRAKGLCSMHWRRKARAEGREANPEWDERRKANYQKRRAQKLNLPADIIRPIEVYERDEWLCGLCLLPVDRTLVYPDPSSASLDHILPLSKGGHHVLENVQLGHLSCNVRKGARVEADAMSA